MPVKSYSLPVSSCFFEASPNDITQIMSLPQGLEWDVTVNHEGGLDPDYCKSILIIEKCFPPIRPMIVRGYLFDGPVLVRYCFQGRTLYGQEVTQFAGYSVKKSDTTCGGNQLHHRFKFVEVVPTRRFGIFKPKIQKPIHMEEPDFRKIFEQPYVEYLERIYLNPAYPSQVEDALRYQLLKERIATERSITEQSDARFLRNLKIKSG